MPASVIVSGSFAGTIIGASDSGCGTTTRSVLMNLGACGSVVDVLSDGYAGDDFDLDGANTSSWGIAFANETFWVVDSTDDKVYAYNADGTRP